MREFLAVAKALSDENRVRTLLFLAEGELCVCQIIGMLGLAPSTVSRHMAVLQQARLVESRKDGRWVYYRLAGREAPTVAREALAWVRRNLAEDPTVRADARRLRKVRAVDRESLCTAYRT